MSKSDLIPKAIRLCQLLILLLAALASGPARAANANVLVIGDSLSAEYDTLPDVPGVDNPTEYSRVTVEGWESLSWVEVLARLRSQHINFGELKPEFPGWLDLRFSGYELNFAVPGFTAGHFSSIVKSSPLSDPLFFPYRLTLADAIESDADRVVIWLGANDFGSSYGFLYDGGDPSELIEDLLEDLEDVVDFVQEIEPNLPIVLVNLPDVNVAPSRAERYPAPAKRERVTQAILQANARIAALASARGVVLADAHSQSERLLAGERTFFGSVEIIYESHPDNSPRYHFTRDRLHPNTPSQIEVARIIISALNSAAPDSIPQITDAEALALLGIGSIESYQDWAATHRLPDGGMQDDPDGDGLANLVEYAFDLDPRRPDASPVAAALDSAQFTLAFRPDPARASDLTFAVESSTDLKTWSPIPLVPGPDQALSAAIPSNGPTGFLRLRIEVRAER